MARMSKKYNSPGTLTRRPYNTLRKESSATDDVELYNERQNSLVPLTSSPFVEKPEPPLVPMKMVPYHPDELRVYSSEVPWSDLLLEIAMTTAFASLSDGTATLEAFGLASYLSFFALVWWVWASQVAYNVRFRQSDWLHRFFVFLQLLVFCALAAFTNNFDITYGILRNDREEERKTQLLLADYYSHQSIAVDDFRNRRLPRLNARGISLTMALSRLVLLAQYVLALLHVPRKSSYQGLADASANTQVYSKRFARISSFLVHIGTLAFSSLCYFAAYVVIGISVGKKYQIAKVALWYLPISLEVGVHFLAAQLPGRVRYPAEAIYARSSTVFVIILGAGLDKITTGFQYIVGNVNMGFEFAGLVLCAMMIVLLQFTLYFSTPEGDKLGSRRAIFLFFFHYLYLSALIVTLQGIAALLGFGNLGEAMELPFRVIKEFSGKMLEKGFGVSLNASDFPDLEYPLNKTGYALDSILKNVNRGIRAAVIAKDTRLPYNYLLQSSVSLMGTTLTNLDAVPDRDSFLMAQISTFYDNRENNYTIVNNETFSEIVQGVFASRAQPTLWFYGAGGSVLVTLAFMCLINRWPRDKYEWGTFFSRLILGGGLIALSALDVGAAATILDHDFKYTGSKIYFLAAHALVLPTYAIALFLEQLVELTLLLLAGRAYKAEGFHVFWRKVRTWPYRSSMSAVPGSKRNTLAEDAFDPYIAYKDKTAYDPPMPRTMNIPLRSNDSTSGSRGMGTNSRSGSGDIESGGEEGFSGGAQENVRYFAYPTGDGRTSADGYGSDRGHAMKLSSGSIVQPLISRTAD